MLSTATLADVPAMVSLVNSAYRGESSKKGWTTEADLLGGQRTDPNTLASIMSKADTVFLKHENEKGELEACVCLEKKDSKIYLGMLTVSPEIQAKGLGRTMLEAGEKYATECGCEAVFMSVISVRAELIAWYGRRGYKITGEKIPFPMSDPRFGLPQQFLEFIVMEKKL